MIKVKVPATSANLGVGFDCMGVALRMYSYFTFEECDHFVISGCDSRFADKNNLVYQAFLYGLKHLKQPVVDNIHIHIDNTVPVSRGLGSSATCVVAGLMAAYAYSEKVIDKAMILKLATALEGHPDNVAPAIFGSICVSCLEDNEVYCEVVKVANNINFQVLIPDFETKTEAMRKVLPEEVTFKDAVYNSSHLGVAIKAFENGELNILNKVLKDRLHEPYRKQLIDEYSQVKEICESIDSVAFLISGSGSTLLNLIADTDNADLINHKLASLEHHWQSSVLKVDECGAQIC